MEQNSHQLEKPLFLQGNNNFFANEKILQTPKIMTSIKLCTSHLFNEYANCAISKQIAKLNAKGWLKRAIPHTLNVFSRCHTLSIMQKIRTLPGVFLVTFLTACSDPSTIIHESSEKSESSQTSLNCVAASPCVDGEMLLWSATEKLRPESPFELYFNTQAPGVKLKAAWLEGVTMYMGKIPVFFEQQGSSLWSAQVMVGACSEPVMEWRMTVETVNRINGNEYVKNVTFALYTTQE
ncbi:hypothetical protein L1285_12065 [Pseudoalteromonas sp. DL2-H2.2]|uniref:hypothetical protein n=1 Tax=Pseudoalteromonas sp. DL2-H2.2 TaxID=2908889 RepID=UPI001F3C8CF9|nr:hypothetical protein [Pseudoalteromonas sp. DL2-H2.2]MCF2909054.1 hypothetical protein [Pseudoalteromonas sp. DL2-H2.2]